MNKAKFFLCSFVFVITATSLSVALQLESADFTTIQLFKKYKIQTNSTNSDAIKTQSYFWLVSASLFGFVITSNRKRI